MVGREGFEPSTNVLVKSKANCLFIYKESTELTALSGIAFLNH
ncbi:protein of unknown function [Shewanella benthica]|uniref:Uncharacterized protein n=1 Tax=Shewanella benthica TaxID=43661 RepID=A0A330M2N4_9GAMM|nr:protein of unknown function [Shewanella benthica]SQH76309.1 protein of unknown function [Shewanella benthica]